AAPKGAMPKNAARHRAAVVTLNRPRQRNAVSLAMWRELAAIFERLGRDPEVRAIILTGAGGNFSAGADIAEFPQVRATVTQGVAYEVAVDRCCDAIAATPKPTIAVVDGYCMGGACHLAMSCDFRFAGSGAQFAIPAARLSIVYGLRATQRLLALVGVADAKRILYSARKFGAAQARRIGFADHVADDPLRAASAFAAVLADNAPLTIAGTKVLLNGLTMGPGALTDRIANQVIERAVGSDDYRDATLAFVEKRQPVFVGK
ncbi:MAG: enoyl-CoA hydratase-related protein, partial [Burkholderiaceae bacterium]